MSFRHSQGASFNSLRTAPSEGLEHWNVLLGYKFGVAVYAKVNGALYSVPFNADYRDGEPKDTVFADTVSRLARRLVRGDGSRKQFKVVSGSVGVKRTEPATQSIVYDLERFISIESGLYVKEVDANRDRVARASLTPVRERVVERTRNTLPTDNVTRREETAYEKWRREYRERHGLPPESL